MGTIDLDNIDFEKLRMVLKEYFESDQIYKNPFAVSDVINIDNVNDYRLVGIAIENGFNIEDFQKENTR